MENSAHSFTEGYDYEEYEKIKNYLKENKLFTEPKTEFKNFTIIEKLEMENRKLKEVLESIKESLDNGDILDIHKTLSEEKIEVETKEERKCCDNPEIRWNKVEITVGDKQGSYLDLSFDFCDNCGKVFNEELS